MNGSEIRLKPRSLSHKDLIQNLWQGFKERYQGRISDRALVFGDVLSKNFDEFGSLREGAKGLVHWDYRPDNMLFATEKGGEPLTVVDWQSFAYGPPASDVGYCIAGALEPNLRRKHEGEILSLYLSQLEQLGVGGYNEEEMRRHYIVGAYQLFLTASSASMLVTQTPRGDDMFFKMLDGAVDLIFDHEADEWLK